MSFINFWLFIAGIISILCLTYYLLVDRADDIKQILKELPGVLFFSAIITCALALISLFVSAFFCMGSYCDESKTVSIEEVLVSMGDSSEVRGQFYLFGGYINTESIYRYYKKEESGAIRQEKTPVTSSVIYEDETESPYVVLTKKVYENCDNWQWYGYNECEDDELIEAEFHIPPNSVSNSFNLDLED